MTNCMYKYGFAYGGFKKVQSKIHIPLKICFTTFYFLFYHTVFKENIAPPGLYRVRHIFTWAVTITIQKEP